MGAVEEEVGGYIPEGSPRFLGDEVEPWSPDDELIRDASVNLQLLEAGYAVLNHENWSFIDSTLRDQERALELLLLHEEDWAKANILRGRIMTLKWVRSLPEVVRIGIEENRRTIAREERGPEETDGEA